jgi:hypothetical protein
MAHGRRTDTGRADATTLMTGLTTRADDPADGWVDDWADDLGWYRQPFNP